MALVEPHLALDLLGKRGGKALHVGGRRDEGITHTPVRCPVDLALRSVKYLLLGLFLFAVGSMSVAAIHGFLEGPYGIVDDVKMLNFFRYLGLTGGIACYKSAELVRLLTKAGATVQVVMTEAATHFITPVTMQALSGRPVFTSQWDGRIGNNMPHIDLSREADAIVIAPASTDFLAKLAHGMADDLLSTLCIARDCPLLVAPAMNRQMWAAPATQRNAAQLRADDVTLLGPDAVRADH